MKYQQDRGSSEACSMLHYRHTSSVSAMLQKLKWNSIQQRRAHSRVLMQYCICHDCLVIPAAVYLQPLPTCTRGFETKYMQIQCNTNTYSQSFLPHTISLWNTACRCLPTENRHLQGSSECYTAHLQSCLIILYKQFLSGSSSS